MTANLGWMAGMAGIIAVLIRISKAPLFDRAFKNPVWLRPVVALVLGVTAGFFQALPGGLMPALTGALAGLAAGAGAVGGVAALNRMTPSGIAEVQITRMVKAIASADSAIDATSKIYDMKVALDKAVNAAPGKKRWVALAALSGKLKE